MLLRRLKTATSEAAHYELIAWTMFTGSNSASSMYCSSLGEHRHSRRIAK
jgi:hypothetical protein